MTMVAARRNASRKIGDREQANRVQGVIGQLQLATERLQKIANELQDLASEGSNDKTGTSDGNHKQGGRRS